MLKHVHSAKWPNGLTSPETRQMTSYTEASRLYRSLGWEVVAPAKAAPDSKTPDSSVFEVFGRNKKSGDYNTASTAQMDGWELKFTDRNCLLKMNRGVVGIDVDHYDKWSARKRCWIRKRGYDSMLEDILRVGDLPRTYVSTSRGQGQLSGISFYRVEPDIQFNGQPYPDVEVIQHHHRYAVVWPSIHPDTGAQYKWYGPDGNECTPPRPSDISVLPREWYVPLSTTTRVANPSKGRTANTVARAPYSGPPSDWIDWLNDDEPSLGTALLWGEILNRTSSHIGHDELLSLVGRIHYLQFERNEFGARRVFDVVAELYFGSTNDPNPVQELTNIIRYVAGEDFQS